MGKRKFFDPTPTHSRIIEWNCNVSQRKKGGRESPEPEAKRAHELSVVANVLRAETQPTVTEQMARVKRGAKRTSRLSSSAPKGNLATTDEERENQDRSKH